MMLLIIPLAIGAILLFANYISHIIMTTSHTPSQWGWGSFNAFLREYKKHEWEREAEYPRSHFGVNYWQDRIHANIIMFDKKGMVLRPFSYLCFVVWIGINRYKVKREKVKW